MSRDEWNALVEQARACDMLKLAAAHGAKLSRYGHGGEYVGGCPVCGTGRDRFSINTKKGVFNCRVCGQGGHGAIDLEMFLGGCEFVEAVKWLTNTTALNGQHRPTARNPEAAAALERERASGTRQSSARSRPGCGRCVGQRLARRSSLMFVAADMLE
jgi:DNA primase